MSFKTLESRFNETVNKLYAAATYKYNDGRASNGRTDEPYIVRKPGESQKGINIEGRGLPFVSTAQDVKRLTLFQISKRGILFLVKQQLLQTGNTFEHTRIINPAFILGNSVPFLHVKRNLRPLALGGAVKSFLGTLGIGNNQGMYGDVASKSMDNLRTIGQLQQETFNKKTQNRFGGVSGLIKKIPFIGQTVSAFNAKRSMGEVGDGWTESRPELKSYPSLIIDDPYVIPSENTFREYGLGISSGYRTYLDFSDSKEETLRYKKTISSIPPKTYIDSTDTSNLLEVSDYSVPNNLLDRYLNDKSIYGNSSAQDAVDAEIEKNIIAVNEAVAELGKNLNTKVEGQNFLKYFSPGAGYGGQDTGIIYNNTDAQKKAYYNRQLTGRKLVPYMSDPLNTEVKSDNDLRTPYRTLPNAGKTGKETQKDDIITVSFAMGADKHVQFRAFMKDLQQTITPKYSEYQYIGRTEKFITYTSVQREVSFKLGIIAYAESELEVVWTRINYLTGLAFPYGFNRGLFSPNIMRMTIGDVYVDQPAYITSLNTDFSGITETWEINKGKQVPISALMNMSVVLIEKNTKIAESPFYGITEKLSGRFSETLPNSGDNNRNNTNSSDAPAQDDTAQEAPIENKDSPFKLGDTVIPFGASGPTSNGASGPVKPVTLVKPVTPVKPVAPPKFPAILSKKELQERIGIQKKRGVKILVVPPR